MDWLNFVFFAVTAAVAGYIQAITGFAFGLIMVGACAIFGLAPVEFTAAFVSFSGLASALISMRGTTGHIRWDIALAVLLGCLPATLLGFYGLNYLSDNDAELLECILGFTILCAGVLLIFNPARYPREGRRPGFMLFGLIGGLMGGAFSVPGPPIVYHIYRQPIPIINIKATLLLIFSIAHLMRLIMFVSTSEPDTEVLKISLLSFPAVLIGTLIGKHLPPALSDKTLRRCAFVLLSGMGMTMIWMTL